MDERCVLLRPIFRLGNSRISFRARSGEYGGWVKTIVFRSEELDAQQVLCDLVRYRQLPWNKLHTHMSHLQIQQNRHVWICKRYQLLAPTLQWLFSYQTKSVVPLAQ
jgi:hypothetical protein